MENYYKNTQFFRLIKGFIMQGGDPTGTGTQDSSIYGEPFEDEWHPRLNFNYRGMLGMASKKSDSNGSQFFITFGPCEDLNKQHTLFGKVIGDTVYNLLNIEKLTVDKNDRPINPPIITGARIIENPFSDIYPRSLEVVRPDLWEEERKKKELHSSKVEAKDAIIKKKKAANLISFEDSEDDDEELFIAPN